MAVRLEYCGRDIDMVINEIATFRTVKKIATVELKKDHVVIQRGTKGAADLRKSINTAN